MARRNQHSLAQLEALIIDAAETIVHHDGIAALTVRRIAVEIGYTVGSLYMVFDSMDRLIARLKLRVWERLAQTLETVCANAPEDITAFLRAWAEAYWRFAQQERHAFLMLFETRRGGDNPDATRHDDLVAALAACLQHYHPSLTTDAASYAARAYWCAVHGVCHLALTGCLPSTDTVTALLKQYAACFSACEVFVPDAANCPR